MENMDLLANEQIVLCQKAFYWPNTFLFLYEQSVGEVIITNMRILFKSKVFGKEFIELEINLKDIDTIKKCAVGTVIPINLTGINIKLKNGQSHKISSYHRKEIMECINNLL